MSWREDLIARHKDTIIRLREDIEFVREHPHEHSVTEKDGKRVDLTEEVIADNLRMIATLERIITQTEADTGQS